MKFYLANGGHTDRQSWAHKGSTEQKGWEKGIKLTATTSVWGSILPITKTQLEKQKCVKLGKKLEPFLPFFHGQMENQFKWRLELKIGISEDYNVIGTGAKGYVRLEGKCLQAIRDISGNTATVKIELGLMKGSSQVPDVMFPIPLCTIFTSEMLISEGKYPFCRDNEILFPTSFARLNEERDKVFYAIIVKIPDTALLDKNVHAAAAMQGKESIPLLQKMLEQEILSDVTVITEDGTAIKAHKNVLACQSSVFLGMFSAPMKENRESEVVIPDMSVESVRAFLRYLYYQDEKFVKKDGELEQILELYNAAHKYNVESLEKVIQDTILEKPDSWFDVETTLRLFTFTQNIAAGEEDLLGKILEVLKRKMDSINDFDAQRLLQKHPAAALELCKLGLSSREDI